MSSGNSYTYIVMNQKPFSVSLMVHRNKQGVETAKKTAYKPMAPESEML